MGQALLPGDKSISHRAAMIAAIAEGKSVISNFASSLDCQSTLDCLKSLGASVYQQGSVVEIEGRGLDGLCPPGAILDAGNSGSTMRMLSGILAGQNFTSEITGDDSLRRRPMQRIIEPLQAMGARIEAREGKYAPLRITGGRLSPINFIPPVASAQVKSCVLLAGLFADGVTTILERIKTRNHTELMLKEFGAEISSYGDQISITGRPKLQGRHYAVPADLSSAAFFIVAALIVPGSEIVIKDVGLNPSRTGILHALSRLGARIGIENERKQHGEPVGDLIVTHSRLFAGQETGTLRGELIANIIDEVPVLAVLATQVDGGITFRDAQELRVKESDRIRAVVGGLRAMGAEVDEFEDGMAVKGRQRLRGAQVDSCGDHRIAMAFAIAGLIAEGETEILGSQSAAISFPEFFATLDGLSQ